jgi:hypothetical protein
MKTNKNSLIALIAVAISTVSCVDDSVSPQVEAIRAQQVEWMKAKTGTELAVAEMKKAETAYQILVNANQVEVTAFLKADNILTLQTKELAYKKAQADNLAAIKQAEANLKIAELNLENALNNLALAVANSKDDQAQVYYDNYSDELTKLFPLYSERLEIENSIAQDELMLAFGTNLLVNFTTKTNLDIADKKLELKAQEESLKSLVLVAANPAAVEAEIDALTLANNKIKKDIASLNIQKATADNNTIQADKAYEAGQDTIKKMSDYKKDLFLASSKVKSSDIAIDEINNSIQAQSSELISLSSELTNAKSVYDKYYTNFKAKVVLHTNASITKNQKLADWNLKVSAVNIAQLNYNQNPSGANGDILDDALEAELIALGAKDAAVAAYNLATDNMNDASVPYQNSKAAVADLEDDIIDLKSDINTNENNLIANQNAKKIAELEETRLNTAITGLTINFNKATSEENALYQAVAAKQKIADDINDDIDALDVTFEENDDLIDSLDNNRSDLQALNNLVTAKKKDIADTNKVIANLEKEILLGDEAQAKTKITANIANMEKDLAALNAKITAAEKLANYWKALLDKIFTV